MRKSKQRIFSFFILSICCGITMTADLMCGDWEPYKNEKCFKFFDKMVSEEEAEKQCRQQENSATLVTIHSKDEQAFLFNFLFNTHNISNSVWIGAKYNSNKFKWADNSDLSYSNWANGSPRNETGLDCVEINSDIFKGKWVNEPCERKNLFVCQKMKSLSNFLNELKELKDSLKDVKKQLNNQQSTINIQESTINNLKQNPVPIGFIYVQFPSQPDPKSLWPTVEWKNITSEYAGLFFRAEGENAAPFGETQNGNSPRLSSVNSHRYESNNPNRIDETINIFANGIKSKEIFIGSSGNGAKRSLDFTVSNGEVRPRNKAVRIWRRI